MSRRILSFFSMLVLLILLTACAQISSEDKTPPAATCIANGLDCAPLPSDTETGRTEIVTLMPSPTSTSTQPPTASDSLQIVYAHAGNIWLWDSNSSTGRQLTVSGQDSLPVIADDGSVIIFRRNHQLWAVDSTGTHPRAITALNSAAEIDQLEFAPHSHDVFLSISTAAEYHLTRVNTDSATSQIIKESASGHAKFVFSPDGAKIALLHNDKINVANIDGSNIKTVFTFAPIKKTFIPSIIWMPDSSGLFTTVPVNTTGRTRFYYISASGGPPAQLAEFTAIPMTQDQPLISPNGSKVLYLTPRDAQWELHIIDASTADQSYLSHAANTIGLLGWTTDSRQFMYWTDDLRQVWLATPGEEPTLLSDVTLATKVTWVDPQRVLFLNGQELRLRVMGEPSRLIDAALSSEFFDFTLLGTP